MRVLRHLDRARDGFKSPVATLGNFDGVHAGHQEILSRVVGQAKARGVDSVVITFYPHPTAVLAPDRAPAALSPLHDRLARIREHGVGALVLQHFTPAFAALEAEEFVKRYLVDRLGVGKVIIGHSVNFGRKRSGTAKTLEEAGRRHGFDVEVVGPVQVDGIAVSSTEVRKRLAAGEVTLAARLLRRAYTVEGRVLVGDRRGRKLGFPTANLRPRLGPLVPNGVYAVRVAWTDRTSGARIDRPGVANVGLNPTFGEGRQRTLEPHLFDFDGDLYGARLQVSFIERLRGELKFSSVDALVEQIGRDAAAARAVLGV